LLLNRAAFGRNGEKLQEIGLLDIEIKVEVALVENGQRSGLLLIDINITHVDEMALFSFYGVGVQKHLLVHLVTDTLNIQLDRTGFALHMTQDIEVKGFLFLGLESDVDHLIRIGLHCTTYGLQ
jgi:hypothetical protein